MTSPSPPDATVVSCPHSLEDVDLFADGAQEHWYDDIHPRCRALVNGSFVPQGFVGVIRTLLSLGVKEILLANGFGIHRAWISLIHVTM